MDLSPGAVIEGTWEEISQHASEFNGHRLRLTVLTDRHAIVTEEERKRRMAAFREWMASPRVSVGTVYDDSREGIYGPDETSDR